MEEDNWLDEYLHLYLIYRQGVDESYRHRLLLQNQTKLAPLFGRFLEIFFHFLLLGLKDQLLGFVKIGLILSHSMMLLFPHRNHICERMIKRIQKQKRLLISDRGLIVLLDFLKNIFKMKIKYLHFFDERFRKDLSYSTRIVMKSGQMVVFLAQSWVLQPPMEIFSIFGRMMCIIMIGISIQQRKSLLQDFRFLRIIMGWEMWIIIQIFGILSKKQIHLSKNRGMQRLRLVLLWINES